MILKARQGIATDGEAGKKGRRDGEKGGKSKTRHEAKITELKKKIFSKRSSWQDENFGREENVSFSREPPPVRRSLALPGVSENLHRAFWQCF